MYTSHRLDLDDTLEQTKIHEEIMIDITSPNANETNEVALIDPIRGHKVQGRIKVKNSIDVSTLHSTHLKIFIL